MSTILLGENLLSSLRIRLPLYGAWTAECVHADPATVPTTGSRVEITLGSQTFSGTVYRTSSLGDMSWDTYVIGGAGALQTTLDPIYYSQAPSVQVLGDALEQAGEELSGDVSTPATLDSWTRTARTLGQELDLLQDALAFDGWRVLSDGTIWIGIESWPVATLASDVDVMSAGADDGVVTIACEDPTILPGSTWEGARICEVVHNVTAKSSRSQLWLGDVDREAGALIGMSGQSPDMAACWPYVVKSQAPDGTVDLSPEDARLPELSGIPILHGIPGCSSEVPAGAGCLVGFKGGSSGVPYIAAWLPGAASSLALVANRVDLGTDPGGSALALATLGNAELTKIASSIQNLALAILSCSPLTPPTVIYGTVTCPKGDVSATKVFGT